GATPGRAALAGLLCGLAVSTKYNAAAILVTAVVAILSSTVVATPRSVGAAARSIAVLAFCAALGFLIGTPCALIAYRTFLGSLSNVRRHMENGQILMTRGWKYHATFTLRYGVGLPLLGAAVLGPFTMLARRRWMAAALLLSFLVSYYWLVGSGKSVFV